MCFVIQCSYFHLIKQRTQPLFSEFGRHFFQGLNQVHQLWLPFYDTDYVDAVYAKSSEEDNHIRIQSFENPMNSSKLKRSVFFMNSHKLNTNNCCTFAKMTKRNFLKN